MVKCLEEKSVFREEVANGVTAGVGLLLSVVGLVLLIVASSIHGNVWHITSSTIYGVTLVFSYGATTLYHVFRSERVKHLFKILDHASIYLLIAGSYTPFTLVSLKGSLGWTLFGLVWGFTIVGIIFKIFFVGRFEKLSLITYLAMGWLIVIAAKPLLNILPRGGVWWLTAGGLLYTAGVVFYVVEKIPYNHAIWHLFVLGGSACHYLAVMFYVIPNAPGTLA